MEKRVPKTSTTGNAARQSRSRGVGINGELRGVEVEAWAEAMGLVLELDGEAACFAARRVVAMGGWKTDETKEREARAEINVASDELSATRTQW